MIPINEEFDCLKCGKHNDKAPKSYRNHCRFCLYSLHLDAEVPGDRKSDCGMLMEPVFVDYKGNKGYQIIHQCLRCKKKIPNIAAPDDNMDEIIKIIQRQNINGNQ